MLDLGWTDATIRGFNRAAWAAVGYTAARGTWWVMAFVVLGVCTESLLKGWWRGAANGPT